MIRHCIDYAKEITLHKTLQKLNTMNNKLILLLLSVLYFGINQARAQSKNEYKVRLVIVDKESNEKLIGATVRYNSSSSQQEKGGISDVQGQLIISVPKGEIQLKVSYIGYLSQVINTNISKDKQLNISLLPDSKLLDEVVVTATESKGLTSSSKIDSDAMKHLQPSSFTDILSLLPGGVTSDPNMASVNTIRLREARSLGSNYDFNSLGTAFVVDGVPLSNDANMQSLQGGKGASRVSQSNGIDMRSISTDNIESVEVIRGIPSVQYGDISTGVVKIKRKSTKTPVQFRFKADQYSKLFYIGKGIDLGRDRILSIDLDFMDSKIDPRNKYENFKRLTASARYQQTYTFSEGSKLKWTSSFDYSSTFDNIKSDPEVDEKEDRYKNRNARMSFNNEIRYSRNKENGLKSISITPSISAQFHAMKQTVSVYLNRPIAVPNSTVEGAHDAIYLPYHYVSDARVDGKPINSFLRINSDWSYQTGLVQHNIGLGGDYRYEKNLGDGKIYDPTRPPSPNMTTRPRKFNEVPAIQKVSFFLEDRFTIPFTKSRLIDIQAGVRGIGLVGMNSKYALNNKIYIDPRINGMIDIIHKEVKNKNLRWRIGGGWGILTKLPTISQLYPELVYTDLEELNYYHSNPEFRRLILNTHIYDPTNFELQANRNTKWEVRSDLSWNSYSLSLTYFKERTTTGFRSMANARTLAYNKYDATGLKHDEMTAPPSIETLPYEKRVHMTTGGYVGNGSKMFKEGLEFQASTPRFKTINTRVTLFGAWFKTTYNDSKPEWVKSPIIINGQELPYLGLYKREDKSQYQNLNTSLMFDTHIPKLGLIFSTTVQSMWYDISKSFAKNTTPESYIGTDGVVHPFTQESAQDPLLRQLILKDNAILNNRVPFEATINFKANKSFGKRINISLFVNKLLSYMPNYKRNNITIYRSVSPYFGMELNIKL